MIWDNVRAAGANLSHKDRIPIPPELMLLGDLLAYIDIFSVLFVLGILSRAATVLFVIKQVAARIDRLASSLMTKVRRMDFRHRRERDTKGKKRLTGRRRSDNDVPVIVSNAAWA